MKNTIRQKNHHDAMAQDQLEEEHEEHHDAMTQDQLLEEEKYITKSILTP